MKTCTKCGSPNDESLTKCARCGARLPRTPATRASASRPSETPPVKNPIGLTVLATVLFPPFGIMAIINAAQVSGWYQTGQIDHAKETAALARRWAQAGIITGLLADTALVIAANLL
ncbi:MAG: CD225/dispanin family protein [Phycisphaerae bacterium]|nr:CD225/dispanin family protein [Phycisphaerae bacterium]